MSDRPLDVRRPAPNGDAKILLIDDEPKVLAPLARLLINSGMRIFTSTNGTEGCKNAIANGPDLILLDVGLPDLSGFEVLRLLKSHHRVADTPVIMMTAANDHDSRVRGWTLGCVDYVTKPFHLDEVKLRIDLHLSLSRQARPADTDASEPLMLSGHTNKDEMLVNAAIGILRDTIANPPGLADLARQLGTNEKRLTQAFQQCLNSTVFTWLRMERLRIAHERVLDGLFSMTEIAEELGYSDLAHFSKSFKAHYGVAPKSLHSTNAAT